MQTRGRGGLNALFLILVDPFIYKLSGKGIKRVFVSSMVFSGWALTLIFFRGQTFAEAITMYTNLGLDGLSEIYNYGFSKAEIQFVLILLCSMIGLEIVHERIGDIYSWFRAKHFVVRWSVYCVVIFTFLLFGAYSEGMSDNAFIYFQF